MNTTDRRTGRLAMARGRMQRIVGLASVSALDVTEAAAGLPLDEALRHSRILDRLGRLAKLANDLNSELAQLEGENLENDGSPNRFTSAPHDAVLSATGSEWALAGASGG